MRILTKSQRNTVRSVIRDHHLALVAELCGPDAIDGSDFSRLKKAGKIGVTPTSVDLVTAAHILGTMESSGDLMNLRVEDFWNTVAKSHTTDETVELAKEKIASIVQNMSARVEHTFMQAANEAEALAHKRQVLGSDSSNRKIIKALAKRLEKATGDAKRDWLRTAHTEVHNLVEDGKALAIAKSKPGSDPIVYKKPRPDACPYCRLLYTDDDGAPRLFRLSSLIANGTNIGRKAGRPSFIGKSATEYKATLGAIHPWCRCTLHHIPDGMRLNSKGQLVRGVIKSQIYSSLDDLQDLINHECPR